MFSILYITFFVSYFKIFVHINKMETNLIPIYTKEFGRLPEAVEYNTETRFQARNRKQCSAAVLWTRDGKLN